MSTPESLLEKVESKLWMLKFTKEETATVSEENEQKEIQRHAKVLGPLTEVYKIKVEVKQLRIEKADDPTEIRT